MSDSSAFIRNGRIVENDYLFLADDAEAPATGRFIVTLSRWNEQHEQLRAAGQQVSVGVRLPNTADLNQVWQQIADRPLIELEFPAFGDGRAYSQARLLRDRYRFAGEIRASGAAVAVDQAREMSRCGIDAFVLRADQSADRFIRELAQLPKTPWYQRPLAQGLKPVFALRRSR